MVDLPRRARSKDCFNELIGPSGEEAFWQQYRRRYITEGDIDLLQGRMNSVRMPIHYNFFLSGNEGFELLDRVIDWAEGEGFT